MKSLLACFVLGITATNAFQGSRFPSGAALARPTRRNERNANEAADGSDLNPLTKASWYAVEAFGNLFGKDKQTSKLAQEPAVYSLDQTPSSRQETLQRIQADNQRQYFLSGTIDELIYDENCVFSDPFVSFQGRDRFVQNLANLGSFITEYSAKPIQYDESTDQAVVTTKFMVKLRLNLPWKPVLAWPWGVQCEIDPNTNLVVAHKESWDIEPLEGVKQIFRKPTTTI